MDKNATVKEKKSIRQWWQAHKPTKRRIIQLYAALLTNANLKGFGSGQIYKGKAKYACVPGMNCYSCPAAGGSCPLGALQNALNATNTKLPYYIFGILLLYGFLFGRWICGFLCPFGLIQDLLYKIKTPKLRKNRFTRIASYFKYILLIVFVLIIPMLYAGKTALPGFCKYICPSGTLLGAGGILTNPNNANRLRILGPLFTWKFILLMGFLVGMVFIYRFFCRFFCPLGAIYGLFNKISWLGMDLNKSKCVDCGLCIGECLMDVKKVGDHECISCGRCVNVCPTNAISYKGPKILLAPNEVGGAPVTKKVNTDPCDAPGTPLPKRTKVARLILAITMGAVLAGSLIYFNVIHKEPEAKKPSTSSTPSNNGGNSNPGDNTGDSTIEVGSDVGNLSSDFEMTLYDGSGTYKPSDSRGKVTVINFWYVYCSACVHELKTEFPELHKNYGDKIDVVVVHSYEEYGINIPDWIEKNFPSDAGYIHCRDAEDDALFDSYGGTDSWPITVILDENGVIQYNVEGSTTYEEMSAIIDKLLAD